jgi:hypothetical protein
MDMRDSEILQAKMAARLLSGFRDEGEVRSPLKYPEPVGKNDALSLSPEMPRSGRI